MIIAGLLEEILAKWCAKRVIENQLIEFKTVSWFLKYIAKKIKQQWGAN